MAKLARDVVDVEEVLGIAVEGARRAGELLLEHFGRPARGITTKSTETDPVTDADRASETLLIELISEERPGDGILAEEGGGRATSTGLTWVVDPLDGTVNFLYRIPAWTVSVAVRDAEGGLAGVVHDPVAGETFSAARGRGARLNGREIHVSNKENLSEALIGTGFAYDPHARAQQAELLTRVIPQVRDIRRAGSAARDLAWVACGRLDGYYEAPVEVWDKAAGIIIVGEAGGVTSDLEAPLGMSSGAIAAGPALFPALDALIRG